jgi:hypothetical protein
LFEICRFGAKWSSNTFRKLSFEQHYPKQQPVNPGNLFNAETPEQQDAQNERIQQNIDDRIYGNTSVISNQRSG